MTSIRLSAEAVANIIASKDCHGCIHYTGQFGTIAGHDRSGYCYRDRTAKFFVEADHGCKKFAYVTEDMPATMDDALVELKDMLDDWSDTDCSTDATVMELLADKHEIAYEAVRHFYDYNPILDYNIAVSATWRTIPGDGWGAYHGPTPDEHEGNVTVTVTDNDGYLVYDDGGTWEDHRGGDAIIAIRDHTSKQKAA